MLWQVELLSGGELNHGSIKILEKRSWGLYIEEREALAFLGVAAASPLLLQRFFDESESDTEEAAKTAMETSIDDDPQFEIVDSGAHLTRSWVQLPYPDLVSKLASLRHQDSPAATDTGSEALPHEQLDAVPEAVPITPETAAQSGRNTWNQPRSTMSKGHRAWMGKVKRGDLSGLELDMNTYIHSHNEILRENVRATNAYKEKCVEAVGLITNVDRDRYSDDLGLEDLDMLRFVVKRGSGCMRLPETPGTTVRGFRHRLITSGPPVRVGVHPLNLPDMEFVEQAIKEDVARGQLVRGSSEWGFPAFPTKETAAHKGIHRKRRVVVDYKALNRVTKRKVFLIPNSDQIKQAVAGSKFISVGDLKEGFNQVDNEPESAKKMAVLVASGTYLPRGLTFGPTNGPEDFQELVFIVFARRLYKDWYLFLHDLSVATGRPSARKEGPSEAADVWGCLDEAVIQEVVDQSLNYLEREFPCDDSAASSSGDPASSFDSAGAPSFSSSAASWGGASSPFVRLPVETVSDEEQDTDHFPLQQKNGNIQWSTGQVYSLNQEEVRVQSQDANVSAPLSVQQSSSSSSSSYPAMGLSRTATSEFLCCRCLVPISSGQIIASYCPEFEGPIHRYPCLEAQDQVCRSRVIQANPYVLPPPRVLQQTPMIEIIGSWGQ